MYFTSPPLSFHLHIIVSSPFSLSLLLQLNNLHLLQSSPLLCPLLSSLRSSPPPQKRVWSSKRLSLQIRWHFPRGCLQQGFDIDHLSSSMMGGKLLFQLLNNETCRQAAVSSQILTTSWKSPTEAMSDCVCVCVHVWGWGSGCCSGCGAEFGAVTSLQEAAQHSSAAHYVCPAFVFPLALNWGVKARNLLLCQRQRQRKRERERERRRVRKRLVWVWGLWVQIRKDQYSLTF